MSSKSEDNLEADRLVLLLDGKVLPLAVASPNEVLHNQDERAKDQEDDNEHGEIPQPGHLIPTKADDLVVEAPKGCRSRDEGCSESRRGNPARLSKRAGLGVAEGVAFSS